LIARSVDPYIECDTCHPTYLHEVTYSRQCVAWFMGVWLYLYGFCVGRSAVGGAE